jgi:hypothetical protein
MHERAMRLVGAYLVGQVWVLRRYLSSLSQLAPVPLTTSQIARLFEF